MNALLKAILKEISDLFQVGQDVVAKDSFSVILPILIEAGSDAAAVVSNLSDFQNELNALLSNPAADADLLTYAQTLVAGDSAKAQKIISAAAKLAIDLTGDVSALVSAIKS